MKKYLIITLLFLSTSYNSFAKTDEQQNQLPVEQLKLFSEVFHTIKKHYVTDISDEALLRHAINGMLQGLDPHSEYLSYKEFLELQQNTKGEFAGIGVEVMIENGLIKIVAPIDDTPAQRAGIQAEDVIVKIDEHAVQGSDLNASIDLLRGKKGSKVILTILRKNQDKPLTISLKRDIIVIKSVKSHMLDDKFAYLRIAQFQETTVDEAQKHLKKLSKKLPQGLILDLRNNPGGLLDAAVGISDLFLDQGLIVYTQGRHQSSFEKYNATIKQQLANTPIVVLLNRGSASASEIVAGALQDHKRALIAGTQSFGKGSVQTILPLPPTDDALKLTTARYFTPNGTSIQAKGITPDVTIQNGQLNLIQDNQGINEASLDNHLENNDNSESKIVTINSTIMNDYVLHEALNLLKTMAIMEQRKQ